MNRTIEILREETKTYRNKTMYRIRMKPSHPYYNKAGHTDKLGGWIEDGVTIDEQSWLNYDSMAFGDTEIKGGVFISGDSKIYNSKIDALGLLRFANIKDCNLKGVLNVTGHIDISKTELDGLLNINLKGLKVSRSPHIKKCSINGSLEINNVVFFNFLNCTFIDNTLITSPHTGNISIVQSEGAIFQGGVKIITGYRDLLKLDYSMLNKVSLINKNEKINSSIGGMLDQVNFSRQTLKENTITYGE